MPSSQSVSSCLLQFQAPVARKPQTLNYINGYAVPGEKSTGLKPVAPPAPAEVVEAEAPPSTLPAWVAYDRKVRPPHNTHTLRDASSPDDWCCRDPASICDHEPVSDALARLRIEAESSLDTCHESIRCVRGDDTRRGRPARPSPAICRVRTVGVLARFNCRCTYAHLISC